MSSDAYVLARFNNVVDLVPATESVEASSSVSSWEAIDGQFHLKVRTRDSRKELTETLGGESKVAELLLCPITDEKTLRPIEDNFCRSFLIVDLDKKSKEKVISNLAEIETVVTINETSGGCDLIIEMAADRFDLIDAAIDNKIRSIDGIVRVKQNRVIELTSM